MAYHMPRDSNTMPICSPSKHKCVEKAVGIVEQTAFDVTGTYGNLAKSFIAVRGVGTHGPKGPKRL